jgi:membrane-bound lytic murein transglycosylase D
MTRFSMGRGLRGGALRRWQALALLVVLGCAPSSLAQWFPAPVAFAAAPAGDAAADANEGRPAAASVPVSVIPRLTQGTLPPKPSRKDERMGRAEQRYLEGHKLYTAGDREGARRMFDEALDLVLNSRSEPVNRSHFDRRFEELVDKIYRLDVDALTDAGNPGQTTAFDKAPLDDIIALTFPVDPKLKVKVREEIGATVSQLPLEASDAVLSFINYFSGERGKRTLIAGLRRSGKYKQMISRILDEEGIPQEFIFLAQAESGFLPRAVSYMSAGGMWQFIRSRGAEYGLRQDNWVDERFDPELATRAAARHLRDLYHHFGDWYLAIAAYNCGPGNVEKAIEKTGYADVWELRGRGTLPLETSNYVPIILAMTIMSKNPENYGIEDVVFEEAINYDTVDVQAMTSLTLVADIVGRPVAELKELNPALLREIAPAGYRLHIPKGTAQAFASGIDMVPPDKRDTWRVYRVAAGDTMENLAMRHRVALAALRTANPSLENELADGILVAVPSEIQRVAPRTTTSAKSSSVRRKPAISKSAARPAPRASNPAVRSTGRTSAATPKATTRRSRG